MASASTSPPPRTRLGTHEVTNQPPPLAPLNLYVTDVALREAVRRVAGDWLDQRLVPLGERMGSAAMLDLGADANRLPPELVRYDHYGQRIDEVRFHPSYHQLMAVAMEERIHDLAWVSDGLPGQHLAHLAPLAVFTQAEAGVMCPIDMTYAAVAALRSDPAGQPWLDRLIGGRYDPRLLPVASKTGITMGMAMTEKQGGSDVRANTTRAEPLGEGLYRLCGHKWFCSAPMSDAFLTLAYAPAGFSCFVVGRLAPDGTRNAINIMRLKDKLGNRSNASAEIEYDGAIATRLGSEGRGVQTIIEMVHHTRLGTVAGTLGIMRMALVQALHHCHHRTVFQKRLIDQPLMTAVLADLALEYEAAVALAVHTAGAFGAPDKTPGAFGAPDKTPGAFGAPDKTPGAFGAPGKTTGAASADDQRAAFARLAVALAKYWLTRRCPAFVFECMEALGGGGYIEDGPMPRLFRESPVNAIWEGSGNVIALDVLRTLRREPAALDAYAAELALAAGACRPLDQAADRLLGELAGPLADHDGRRIAQQMALLWQAALLVRHAPSAVADAFVATRIAGGPPAVFGSLPAGLDLAAILGRQPPGR